MISQLTLLTSGHYSHLREPLVLWTCPNTSVIHIHDLPSYFCLLIFFLFIYDVGHYVFITTCCKCVHYYLNRHSSFYCLDHCKCYLSSLVTPVYSLHYLHCIVHLN